MVFFFHLFCYSFQVTAKEIIIPRILDIKNLWNSGSGSGLSRWQKDEKDEKSKETQKRAFHETQSESLLLIVNGLIVVLLSMNDFKGLIKIIGQFKEIISLAKK